ncbi:hypothetical protein PIB30_000108 [Stylosanthes scabra]|uniref:GRF-type domain-containing protein n=1 Tax=Stylosanthes scabra TaxID=79078 RepID=A0ABU6R188_9FABA|nr:hypothetical protein [Stylosanthes scabra]
MMGHGNGGRGSGLPCYSHGSCGSSSSTWRRKKSADQICFCGLKTMIKKSRTTENPDRLFHTCSRYSKGSHCNYFQWVDKYEGVAEGANGHEESYAKIEGDYDA